MAAGKENEKPREPPSPWALFRVFFGISAVTIGGGYAMVPVIGRALEKRLWLDEDEFYRLFARAQSFPGPLAFTTALIAGGKLSGPAGAAAAAAGVVLPPFGALVLVGAALGLAALLALLPSLTLPVFLGSALLLYLAERRWKS